jgi:UDP-N-acetylglucosamine--N-acetylmuramyl-(pentapeptide) pyrophosphoryl-undecaprenol N-acetylglucosamine transferase
MVKGFVSDMYRYTGAANIVIARGGATNLAELAVQGKTCIIVPNASLTGGHQLKNTAELSAGGAIIEMTTAQIQQELRLASVVSDLIDNPVKAAEIAKRFVSFAHPDAAKQLAKLLLQKSKNRHPHGDRSKTKS